MRYYSILTMLLLSGLLLVPTCHANGNQDAISEMGNNTPFTISIEPPQDPVAGEFFTIRGATNLPLGDTIQIEIYSIAFRHANPGGPELIESTPYEGRTRIITDANGDHVWSFDINTTALKPDEYLIRVYSLRYGDGIHSVTDTALFNLIPGGVRNPSSERENETPSQDVTDSTPPPVKTIPETHPAPLTIGIPITAVAMMILIEIYRRSTVNL
ncbi:MAG: hypothetical protein A4E35_00728 [Methanoregula sp. PtaU1.Bin051]|nr:MAG: hypothetical protein A4E35_00728 [Methanoregula sp. PtaU1.Bin051]